MIDLHHGDCLEVLRGPLVAAAFVECNLRTANTLLEKWAHQMGPLNRGNKAGLRCHVLYVGSAPVAVATTSSLIRECVGGGLGYMDRSNTIELSRLCAGESWACRVALRLWREAVFPLTAAKWAISYQDATLHTGNVYRFDGWKRMAYSSSGTDRRSGRKGRKKWIWAWEARAAAVTAKASEPPAQHGLFGEAA